MGRKGVILSGGRGSRLHPLTRVTSKQLLPVYDKPMIYYPLSVLMMAGIQEVMIVSSSHDLPRFQALFGDGSSLGISMSYGVQEIPLGIAHAFLVAEEFIASDNVTLILGDNIYYGQQLEEMLKNMEIPDMGATIFGYLVKHPEKYGVVRFDAEGKPLEILEKPKNPPSGFAVTGLYFYDNQVIEIAKKLKPSERGEIEITDVNNVYLDQGQLNVVKLGQGFAWFDSGTFEDLYKASTYVQLLQETHNTMIGCIEEVAYRNGWIDREQLSKLAHANDKSPYGQYLRSLIHSASLIPSHS